MKVLFIQEQTFLATALRLAFITKGYDLHVSNENISPETTIEAYNPSIIIADITKGRGYNYVEEAKRKNVPVIVICNNAGENNFEKAIDKGANDYLSMPLSFAELVLKVNTLTQNSPALIPILNS